MLPWLQCASLTGAEARCQCRNWQRNGTPKICARTASASSPTRYEAASDPCSAIPDVRQLASARTAVVLVGTSGRAPSPCRRSRGRRRRSYPSPRRSGGAAEPGLPGLTETRQTRATASAHSGFRTAASEVQRPAKPPPATTISRIADLTSALCIRPEISGDQESTDYARAFAINLCLILITGNVLSDALPMPDLTNSQSHYHPGKPARCSAVGGTLLPGG